MILGRGPLVDLVAVEIAATAPGEGMVIAVTGPWGCGKTSVLRLIERRLRADAVVLHFNPWLFSGAEQLVLRFFSELGGELRNSGDERLQA
jgi:predicted KAP-like P-loop ATPase